MEKFHNFEKNLSILEKADQEDRTNEFIVNGIIDKFMIQFELSWKLLKELLKYEGIIEAESGSPRQILKAAYQTYDFIHEKVWLDMLDERNHTAHIYNGDAAEKLVEKIITEYIPEFQSLKNHLLQRYGERLYEMSTTHDLKVVGL